MRKEFSLQARRYGTVVFAATFPLLAHVATVLESRALTLASVAFLAAAILLRPLVEGQPWARIAAPFAALAIAVLWGMDAVGLLLYLPPVAVNVFLAWLFGHSLARGSRPLIERLVLLLQPPGAPPAPAVLRYAGRLTRVWTALFMALAVVNLALAALATPGGLLESSGFHAPVSVSRETWSLFANLLNYVIVAAFFLLEYAYRRRRFPDRPYRNFVDFLRRTAAVAPRLAATFRTIPPATIEVPHGHPAFAGHFPGQPLLPGVVLLERVIEAAGFAGGSSGILEMPWAKFLAPLLPGDRATIRFRQEEGTLHFEVRREGQRVAQGVMRVGPGPETG